MLLAATIIAKRNKHGGRDGDVDMERQKKCQHSENCEVKQADSYRSVFEEEAVGFNVDVEVRNHNQGDDEKRGYQHACNDGREVVQQFLQSEEIPRCLGRVRSVGWIGDAFEWSVEQQRENHQ